MSDKIKEAAKEVAVDVALEVVLSSLFTYLLENSKTIAEMDIPNVDWEDLYGE